MDITLTQSDCLDIFLIKCNITCKKIQILGYLILTIIKILNTDQFLPKFKNNFII